MDNIEKKNKGRGIVLGIIAFLIISLIGVGVYYYLKIMNTNVYIKLIDDFSSSSINILDKTDYTDKKEIQFDAFANIISSEKSVQNLANVINKIKVKSKIQSDFENKKLNENFELFYNNKSVIDGNIYINNNDAYFESKDLYNKLIKYSLSDYIDTDDLWTRSNKDDYKSIITELTNILKDNLKDDYFNISSETINIMGKEVNDIKQTFTLTYNQEKEFRDSVRNDILANEKLLNSLSKIMNINVDELKESIKEEENYYYDNNDYAKDSDVTFLSEIYLNKKTKELDRAYIKYGYDYLEIIKTDDNTYDIKVNNEKYGILFINKEELKISLNVDDMSLIIDYKENSINAKYKEDDLDVEITLNGNDTKGDIKVIIKESSIEAIITMNYTINNISNVDNVNYDNYIDYDKLTESDVNSIINKIYQNNNLSTMIQDLMSTAEESYMY